MKINKKNIIGPVFSVFLIFCCAYTVVTRCTNFFMASRTDKIIYLAAALLSVGSLFVLLFKRSLFLFLSKATVKIILISALLSVVFFHFVIQPLYFPEQHTLEIYPVPLAEEKNLIIESINRVEFPKGEKRIIAPSQLAIQKNWDVDGSTGTITWLGDSDAKIEYGRLMQAGVEINFKAGPQQSSAKIVWDGQVQTMDLNAPLDSSRSILLIPQLNWARADLARKILVSFAYISQYVALITAIACAILIPQVYTFRHAGFVFICMLVLVLLLPMVQALDPIVNFQDYQLENAVRSALNNPEGDIRKHKLLTIAELDLTSLEIYSLEGIQHLTNLASLNLRDNHINEIAQLEQLSKLRDLNLRGNQITDLTPITKLTKIESLNVRDNPISNLSPIKNLVRLRDLNLGGIPLSSNLNLLVGFPDLIELNLRNCSITDITLLAELMARGILQDDPIAGTKAHLDIRDNPIQQFPLDGYQSIRPYWENISSRVPFILPVVNLQDPPIFSHVSGFYEHDFWLDISAPSARAQIHYTLDGSQPTLKSPVYQQPLLISSRAGQPNNLSMLSDMSPQWEQPLSEVYKASVVRAVAFFPDGSQSRTITHTFFVDPDIAGRYTIPIISLTTNPDNLFDDEYGVYTIGTLGRQLDFLLANYFQRGGAWERPVSIEIFDHSGNLQITQDVGFRVHGTTTREYPQKSLRLIANKDYGQSDFFNVDIFPGLHDSVGAQPIDNFKTLLLRNSGNIWSYFFFRNTLMQSLVDTEILDIQTSQPVIVLLNGEYWGIYDLRENLDVYYLASHYQIDPQEIVILERDAQLDEGEPGDQNAYQRMLNFINETDITVQENYHFISTQMDIDNFIDYQISEIYSRNENWPHDNIKYWRYKADQYVSNAAKGQDGKWRWLLFDLDNAFGVVGGENAFRDNSLIEAEGAFLFRELLLNSAFRIQFINRFADQLNTFYTPDRVTNVIKGIETSIAPEIEEHMNRWNIMDASVEEWNASLERLYEFAAQRPTYVRQHIVDRFNLPGTASVTLIAESGHGYLRINSIDILPDTPGVVNSRQWSGIYFKDIPINISAIPETGYKFAGWVGLDQAEPDLELVLDDDLVLTADFLPIE